MKKIYFDYAATTPADKRVVKFAQTYFSKRFGNPSSSHLYGQEAKSDLKRARELIAKSFGCKPEEVFFTSGGTESENLAIKGIAFSAKKYGKHVIISAVEHASVDSSASFLEKQGFEITRIPVDSNCVVDLEKLKSSIKDDTTLISVMYVNNEIGTIEPIKEISEIIRSVNEERTEFGKHKIHFHVDGEAASIYLDYDVHQLGVDSLSINGSKVYSLKGSSALFLKEGSGVATQICGGGQELLLRGGTENVPAIMGLAKAVELASSERVKNVKKVTLLKKHLSSELLKAFPNIRINTPNFSIANMLHVTFLGIPVIKNLVDKLSDHGVAVSRGAACAANKNNISQVMEVLGFSQDEADMSLRISLGKFNKISDIREFIKVRFKAEDKGEYECVGVFIHNKGELMRIGFNAVDNVVKDYLDIQKKDISEITRIKSREIKVVE